MRIMTSQLYTTHPNYWRVVQEVRMKFLGFFVTQIGKFSTLEGVTNRFYFSFLSLRPRLLHVEISSYFFDIQVSFGKCGNPVEISWLRSFGSLHVCNATDDAQWRVIGRAIRRSSDRQPTKGDMICMERFGRFHQKWLKSLPSGTPYLETLICNL